MPQTYRGSCSSGKTRFSIAMTGSAVYLRNKMSWFLVDSPSFTHNSDSTCQSIIFMIEREESISFGQLASKFSKPCVHMNGVLSTRFGRGYSEGFDSH